MLAIELLLVGHGDCLWIRDGEPQAARRGLDILEPPENPSTLGRGQGDMLTDCSQPIVSPFIGPPG